MNEEEKKKKKSLFSRIKKWFKDKADWIQENLGDPAIAAALRDDVGLKKGEDIPKAKRDEIQQFAKGFDPDKVAFSETVQEVIGLYNLIKGVVEDIKEDQGHPTDLIFLFGQLAAYETIRLRNPEVGWVGKLTNFIFSDPEELTRLNPAWVIEVTEDPVKAFGNGEKWVHGLAGSAGTILNILENIFESLDSVIDVYHGWDPTPGTATPVSDRVSTSATTFVIGTTDSAARLLMTMLAVPPEHGGTGLFVSFGGALSLSHVVGNKEYIFDAGTAGGLDLYITAPGSELDFEAGGDVNAFVKVRVQQNAENADEPAFRIGDADKTRLDIGSFGYGVDLNSEAAAFNLFIRDGELVIKLSEADGFVKKFFSGDIRLVFDLNVTADTSGGLRVDGGTLLRATIPVNKSVLGFLDIHHVDLSLGPDKGEEYDASLEFSTALALKLGPFKASVDRIGYNFKFAFKEGNLGFMDATSDFKPPQGIGLSLSAGPIKGGGYLFLDPDKGEYAGALELKFKKWGLKALGILTTKKPDGSDGFALLLMIYADLPRFHIAAGVFFEGVGGIIGIQHGVDVETLQAQIPTGALDDILFPANPVADAPRIIQRLRVIFPLREHALTIGPVFKLTWGTPAVGEITMGLIFVIDNLFNSDVDASLSNFTMIGTLRIGLPEAKKPDVARIVVDFVGFLDTVNKRFGFFARLRDSKLAGSIELTGSLVVQWDYGEKNRWVLAAGGFHPRFKDIPDGLPAKLDRIGIKHKIGIVNIQATCYVAITPATIQFGADVTAKAKLGPVSIDGTIGLDALIYYEPYFHFEFDFRVGFSIKFKGRSLSSIKVEGLLEGPGLWHISGKLSFSILWWDITKSFDEEWGERPVLEERFTNVSALLLEAYNNDDNWAASLPENAESFVALNTEDTQGLILSHPLARVEVSQKVAPLDITLEKFGETKIEGANHFVLENITVGSKVIANPDRAQEHLSRSDYLNLSEEDLLSKPSFESFNVGATIATDSFDIPAEVTVSDLNYETRYFREETSTGLPRVEDAILGDTKLQFGIAIAHARLGAVAAGPLRVTDRLLPASSNKLVFNEPVLAAVNTSDLSEDVLLSGFALTNVSLAEERVAEAGGPGTQLVELFELTQ